MQTQSVAPSNGLGTTDVLALLALIVVRQVAPPDVGRESGKLSVLLRDSDIPGILAFIASLTLAMMALGPCAACYILTLFG